MGNCCKPASSSLEWGGDDWGSLTSENTMITRKTRSSKVFDETQGLCLGNVQKDKLLGVLSASSDNINGTVKIKISKKELTELLGGMEKQQQQQIKKKVGQASAEQVLLRLIKARDRANQHHHGLWKPMLESIPEVN